METSVSYSGRECAYLSSDERKWIDKIYELREEFPELVEVITAPEDNDGCIYAKIPVDWFKIRPARKPNISDELRQSRRENMLRIRKDRTKKN